MKSRIRIDTNYRNEPIINIEATTSREDLRDKLLNVFLEKLQFVGRLCFIDSSGSKKCNSAMGETSEHYLKNFTITPISPEHYELLKIELDNLIQERNEDFERRGISKDYIKNEIISKQRGLDFETTMNY